MEAESEVTRWSNFQAKLEIQISSWKFLIFKTPWVKQNSSMGDIQPSGHCVHLNLTYQLEFLLLYQVFLLVPPHRGSSDQKAWLGLENMLRSSLKLLLAQGFIPPLGPLHRWVYSQHGSWLLPEQVIQERVKVKTAQTKASMSFRT